MSVDITFTKENLDSCLSRLAKLYEKYRKVLQIRTMLMIL